MYHKTGGQMAGKTGQGFLSKLLCLLYRAGATFCDEAAKELRKLAESEETIKVQEVTSETEQ